MKVLWSVPIDVVLIVVLLSRVQCLVLIASVRVPDKGEVKGVCAACLENEWQ